MRLAVICVSAVLINFPGAGFAQTLLGSTSRSDTSVYLSVMGEPVASKRDAAAAFDQWFRAADADDDDALTMLELLNDANRFFGTLDLDGNGRIERPEMERYEKEIAPPNVRLSAGARHSYIENPTKAGASVKRTGKVPRSVVNMGLLPGGEPAKAQPDSFSVAGVSQPVARADTDINGIVTQKEFQSAAIRNFTALDQNRDQKLVREDFMGTR